MKETFAFQIVILYREFLAYTTNELKALGLSFGQMPLVVYVGKHPGCTQAALCARAKCLCQFVSAMKSWRTVPSKFRQLRA